MLTCRFDSAQSARARLLTSTIDLATTHERVAVTDQGLPEYFNTAIAPGVIVRARYNNSDQEFNAEIHYKRRHRPSGNKVVSWVVTLDNGDSREIHFTERGVVLVDLGAPLEQGVLVTLVHVPEGAAE